MEGEEERFKVVVVAKILDAKTEEALELLCKHYHVVRPRLGVGVFEGKTRGVRAVYSSQRKEILAVDREAFYDPFVIIHEFYHHLRTVGGKHRGTEKQADKFALDFLAAYGRFVENANRLARAGWNWTGKQTDHL